MDGPGSFEKNMKRLEEIVAALESPDLSLEDGMALYREGAQCASQCRQALEKAKHELEMWQDGNVTIPDFQEKTGA